MTDKGYRRGTHRAVTPEVTLARIRPLLPRYGITRLADVTGLDSLGVPTFCAIRPAALTLQVSNGKGLRRIDAQVSALMESIELAHGEEPPARPLRTASLAELEAEGARYSFDLPARVMPRTLPVGRFEWVEGVELVSGEPCWLPAAIAWARPRQVVPCDWNGLASGNTLTEATLHALFEILERHMLSSFYDGKDFDFASADVLDPSDPGDEIVRALALRIQRGGVRLVLLRVNHELSLHAFMALILDPEPLGGATAVNLGYGAHLSPSVAATRAITEAAQTRLTFIHGAREDLPRASFELGAVHGRLFEFFERLRPDTTWDDLHDLSSEDLETDLALLLETMAEHQLPRSFRIDMSHPGMPFSVVKVFVPGALLRIPV